MNSYRRTLRGISIAGLVVFALSAMLSLILLGATGGAMPTGGVGLVVVSTLLMSIAGVAITVWLVTFLLYLHASSIAAGHADIVAAIEKTSTSPAPLRPQAPVRQSSASDDAPADHPDPLPSGMTAQRPGSAELFEPLLGRTVSVRGYTGTTPPHFRRVEGVLTKDSAGQYWVGNLRVDSLDDTKVAVI